VTFTSIQLPRVEPSEVDSGYDLLDYTRFLEVSCDLGHTPIQAPTAVVRNDVQQLVGGFLPEHPHSGDTEIWLRLAAQGRVVALHTDQAFRRLHPSSMSCNYSLLGRLEEHKRAFDAHFEKDCPLADVDRYRTRLYTTLGRQAFWLGARAFDEGDAETCEACLAFARAADPTVESMRSWRRLELKRRLGTRAWSMIRPLSELASRAVVHARH
jgi:hypothetical protein